jgi:hypothetical protein
MSNITKQEKKVQNKNMIFFNSKICVLDFFSRWYRGAELSEKHISFI